MTACSFLTSANVSHQVACTRASAVRDEEAAGSNPATPTQVTGHSPQRDVAFFYAVQQRLRAKLPPEPLERLERLGIGDLGVDVHRHVDLRMTQNPHGNPGVHVERGESGTGVSHVVHGDAADACLGAACLETTVQVPR